MVRGLSDFSLPVSSLFVHLSSRRKGCWWINYPLPQFEANMHVHSLLHIISKNIDTFNYDGWQLWHLPDKKKHIYNRQTTICQCSKIHTTHLDCLPIKFVGIQELVVDAHLKLRSLRTWRHVGRQVDPFWLEDAFKWNLNFHIILMLKANQSTITNIFFD